MYAQGSSVESPEQEGTHENHQAKTGICTEQPEN